MKRTMSVTFVVLSLVFLCGCRFFQDVSTGFTVNTKQTITTSSGQTISNAPLPHTWVEGDWLWDDPYGHPAGYFYMYRARTNEFGKYTVYSGRTDAYWDVSAFCFGSFWNDLLQLRIKRYDSVVHNCRATVIGIPFSSTRFEIAGSTPSTLTLGGQGLSAQNGMPMLYVYDRWANMVNRIPATQVAPDGTSATFPFPTQQSGAPLTSDGYGMAIVNWDTPTQTFCEPMYDEWGDYIGDYCWDVPGELRTAGANYIGIGSTTNLTTPFGVDATSTYTWGTECYTDPYGEPDYPARGRSSCTDWNYTSHDPIVTLSSPGQVYYRGLVLGVGSSPTAVKVYWTDTQTDSWGDPYYSYEQTTTQPSRALVVNSGSNSVSVIDLIGWQVIATVPVGSRPTGLLIMPDESKAYVANFDSSTVSEIELSTNLVMRTISVGSHPTAITLDPGGAALWVGGQGWLYKINLASFGVVATYTVNGTITSMATSTAQNSLVYTAITNSSAPESTYGAAISYSSSLYSVSKLRLTDMSISTGSSSSSASAYQYSAIASTLPTPSLLAGGTRVSVNYGNGISVSATPDGFVVMDVPAGAEIMRGRTPTPVRAIASDLAEGVVYLTVPDSNLLIRVRLNP